MGFVMRAAHPSKVALGTITECPLCKDHPLGIGLKNFGHCSCSRDAETKTVLPLNASNAPMKLAELRGAFVQTYSDILWNHTLQMAAALAYYFVLSLSQLSSFYRQSSLTCLFQICSTRPWPFKLEEKKEPAPLMKIDLTA